AVEKPAPANVGDQRRPARLSLGVGAKLGKLGDQRRGEVVDAKVTQILKAADRFGLACPREPRDDHQLGGVHGFSQPLSFTSALEVDPLAPASQVSER